MFRKISIIGMLLILILNCSLPGDSGSGYTDDPNAAADVFTFTDVSGAAARDVQTSNTITVSGLGANVRTTAKITAGAGYIILNGTPTGTQQQNVIDGDTVALSAQAPQFGGSSASSENIVLQIGSTSDTWTITSQSVSITYGSGLGYFSMPYTQSSGYSDKFAVPIQTSSSMNVDYIGVGINENSIGLYMEAMPYTLAIHANSSGEPGAVIKSYSFADSGYDYYFGGTYGSDYIPMDSKQVVGDGHNLSAGTYWVVMTWTYPTQPYIASSGGTSIAAAGGLSRKYYDYSGSSWTDGDDSSTSVDAADAVAVYLVDVP